MRPGEILMLEAYPGQWEGWVYVDWMGRPIELPWVSERDRRRALVAADVRRARERELPR